MSVTIEISDGMADIICSQLEKGETIKMWVMEAIANRFQNMPSKSQVRPMVRQDDRKPVLPVGDKLTKEAGI